MAVEVPRVVLALAVHVVRRFGEDNRTGFAGALAVAMSVLDAHLDEGRAIWRYVALSDREAALARSHLDAVVGDPETHGEPERLYQPIRGGAGVWIEEHRNHRTGRN